ncbi:MAG: DctP family TRAP transporter solute-binding subunit [Candidatus Latescibacterota bacterium]
MRKRIFTALFLAVWMFSCGNGSDPVQEFRLSLILGSNSDWCRGALKFKELIEKRTDGACRIGIYPHAQLAGGVQRTELEMVQSGVIDLSLESSILLSLVEERMGVLSLPWLFRDYEQASRILAGPLGGELLGLLPEKGLVGLAYGANGFRQITNSRLPIRTPEDLADLKVRIPAIRLYIDIFKRLGADPSSMNFGELFPALAQGAMDGQENPAAVIFNARLFEVQKYLTVWNYSYDPIILCMNRKKWDSLSPEMQGLFLQCAREAMEYQFRLVADGEQAALDSLRARGVQIDSLDAGSRERFRELVEPIYRKYGVEAGAGLIKRMREAARNQRD